MKRLSRIAVLLFLMCLLMSFAIFSPRENVTAEALVAESLAQGNSAAFEGANIYFADTSFEPSRFDRGPDGISTFGAVLRELGATLISLDWRLPFPDNIDVLVIIGPAYDYTPDQISRLWSFITSGGRVFMAINPTTDRLRNERGAFYANNNFFLLANSDYGLNALDNMLVIEETPEDGGAPFLQTRFETEDYNTAHPILSGVTGPLSFRAARSLTVDVPIIHGETTPLIFAPSGFYGEVNYQRYIDERVYNFDIGTDTTPGRLPIAAAYENDRSGTRLFLIGDRDLVTNGFGFSVSPVGSLGFVHSGNVQLTLQAIAWLLEREAPEFAFPTPGPTATVTITPSPTPSPSPTGNAPTPTAGS